jgi:O-antigen ligase
MIALAMAGVGIGVGLAWLPLWMAALGLSIGLGILATIYEPMIGLGIALIFATFKPFTDYVLPELPTDIGQIAMLITLGVWLLRAAIQREIRLPKSPINLPLGIFLIVMLLTIPGALSAGSALKEMVKWAQLVLIMWLVIEITPPRRYRIVIGMILAAGIVQALIGIWQFAFRGDGPDHYLILNDQFYRAYGTFEQPNPYGGFIGMVLPLAGSLAVGLMVQALQAHQRTAEERTSIWMAAAGMTAISGILLVGLIASWSRGAWLGFAGAAGIMALAWPRRLWIGSGVAIGAIVAALALNQAGLIPASITARLADFSSEITSFDARGVDITSANYAVIERLAYWQAAGEMAQYHPLLGVGFNNYGDVYPGYALLNWPQSLSHAHNIYLNFLAETGVIGLMAYIGLWATIVWQTWWASRHTDGLTRSICIGLLGTWTHLSVHQFFDKLYVANMHMHIGAMLGILSIIVLSLRQTPSDLQPSPPSNGGAHPGAPRQEIHIVKE